MQFEDMINKIINDDCYKFIKQIPNKSIDLIITDPPFVYGIAQKTEYGCFKKRKKTIYDEIVNNGLDNSDYLNILDDLVRVMKKINIYIWCSKNQIKPLMDYFIDKYSCAWDLIVWHKTNCPPFFNHSYLTDKEYCLYFREDGCLHPNNYNNAKTIYSTQTNKNDRNSFKHPTIKPLKIIENLIINSSNENDIVLDCFCGSGTTCVACKNNNRRYIGIEINKEYYDIAIKRLNNEDANGQISLFTN